MADEAVPHDGLSHLAFFYRDQAEYLACIQAFAHEGVANAEPVFVAVPGDKARLVRTRLGAESSLVSCDDMAELGRNPGRLISALRAFAEAHPGRRVRYVSEPVWPGRDAAETCEAARHEALVNLAFSTTPVTMMCPYDAAGLGPGPLSEARITHPLLLQGGEALASGDFRGPGLLPPECDLPLPAPPSFAQALGYGGDLRPVRRLVAGLADEAGLPPERAADLVLAVSEVAANTLRHTQGDGLLRIWQTEQEILCQIQDYGWITDPLAGQQHRPADQQGHGLWLVNQVCDLVELRSGPAGTTVRMHMRLGQVRTSPAPGPWQPAAGSDRTPRRSPG